MTTRRTVMEKANDLGAEVEVSYYGGITGRGMRVSVYAPDGFVWYANDAHVIVADNNGEGGAAWCWRDTYARMNEGVERCRTEDCDACEATP